MEADQNIVRRVNLTDLNGGIDEDTQVHHNNADYLNGVLALECIVDEKQLIDEAKNEQRQIGGDGFGIGSLVCSGRICGF